MRIASSSDHAGYNLKSEIARWLAERGYAVRDLGTDNADTRVDYPDFARAVAQAVTGGECNLGIAVCGTGLALWNGPNDTAASIKTPYSTGLGVSITANKVPGVRAALCTGTYTARMSRLHNDANVLCLGQQVVGIGLALDIVAAWLQASFEGGRHAQRLAKIGNTKGTKVGNTKGTKVGNTKGTKVGRYQVTGH